MSIWASWPDVGVPALSDGAGGNVKAYTGRYPTKTDQTASLGIATVGAHCIPGAPDDADEDEYAPWLRLSIVSPLLPGRIADVTLDETAATVLRDQLTEWILARIEQVP